MEPKVTVICRKQDIALVNGAIKDAVSVFNEAKLLKNGAPCECTVSVNEFLPDDSAGGIICTALEGRVRTANTLDARLELLSQEVLFYFYFFLFFLIKKIINYLIE